MINYSIYIAIALPFLVHGLSFKKKLVVRVFGIIIMLLSISNIGIGYEFLQSDWVVDLSRFEDKTGRAKLFAIIGKFLFSYWPQIILVEGWGFFCVSLMSLWNTRKFIKENKDV